MDLERWLWAAAGSAEVAGCGWQRWLSGGGSPVDEASGEGDVE